MNAQKRMFLAAFLLSDRSVGTHKNGGFFLCFCTETEQCERVASMQQKRILTKKEQCERGLNLSVLLFSKNLFPEVMNKI